MLRLASSRLGLMPGRLIKPPGGAGGRTLMTGAGGGGMRTLIMRTGFLGVAVVTSGAAYLSAQLSQYPNMADAADRLYGMRDAALARLHDLTGRAIESTSTSSLPPSQPPPPPRHRALEPMPGTVAADEGTKDDDDDVEAQHRQDEDEATRLQEELLRTEADDARRESAHWKSENEKLMAELLRLRRKLQQDGAGGRRSGAAGSLLSEYSDILDLLSQASAEYRVQEHLPRVVVVGDQSAGKTSVLEVMTGARVFPRGGGEMMTRAPVQVMLEEGPERLAWIGTQRYEISKETELERLRTDIKELMWKSAERAGGAISTETISLSVQGPGLRRVVLVDLPGVIAAPTRSMPASTKREIEEMCRTHMSNPNALILCVQDGSTDAERSNAADVVRTADPDGTRTIVVLTKVDVAEQQMREERVAEIMKGNVFNLNALAYFAVVAGTASPDDNSIEAIKRHENDFFRQSKLVRHGHIRHDQRSTRALASRIDHEFWRLVRVSVREEAVRIQRELDLRESEWKSTFKGAPESRDTLYQRFQHRVLDALQASARTTSPRAVEETVLAHLWGSVGDTLLHEVYMSAAGDATFSSTTSGGVTSNVVSPMTFATHSQRRLREWNDLGGLSRTCVHVGLRVLLDGFHRELVDSLGAWGEAGAVLKDVCAYVETECARDRDWPPSAVASLAARVGDTFRDVPLDGRAWDDACAFQLERMHAQAQAHAEQLQQVLGPTGVWQCWVKWRSPTPVQRRAQRIHEELQHLINATPAGSLPPARLSATQRTAVRENLVQRRGVSFDDEDGTGTSKTEIEQVYEAMYAEEFAKRSAEAARFCRGKQGTTAGERKGAANGLECEDVVLFWRIQSGLRAASNSVRMQLETQHTALEMDASDAMETLSGNTEQLRTLLSGHRVDLAEAIVAGREVMRRLERFVILLEQDQSKK